MTVTFVSCWYICKAKFDVETYDKWISNFLNNVVNCNIVIYTDNDGYNMLLKYKKENIKLIKKDLTQFYTYQYKNDWIKNHKKNYLLNHIIDWKVNMIWNEKIYFVHETMTKKYYDTEFYGWCDIGYFRGKSNDIQNETIKKWPCNQTILSLKKDKVYYALVNRNTSYIQQLQHLINNKNSNGLPHNPIPPNQESIAGGFFISHKDNITNWCLCFYKRLKLYFQHNYLVKDDQIIIADCVFSDSSLFHLCEENDPNYNNWFMFQRILL